MFKLNNMNKINYKIPYRFPMYDPPYGGDVPIEQLYANIFDAIPSQYSEGMLRFKHEVLDVLNQMGYYEIVRIHQTSRSAEKKFEKIYINENNRIIIKVNYTSENRKDYRIFNSYHRLKQLFNTTNDDMDNRVISLEFFYCIMDGELNDRFDFSKLNDYVHEKKKSHIQLVRSDMGHLDTEEYDLNVNEMDLTLNYGEEFARIHDVVVERLNTPNDKGIILLHGDPGTGKTSYIKYLTTLIKDKPILFIPPSMAEMLSEPTIIPFLMDQRNSILIIEDAERVISDRQGNGSQAGVSNILNITDGILGDCLGIQIIATFNMSREKIDSALLRKGRLIAEHKFTNLSVENSNKLLKTLGKGYTTTIPMSLADIYNIDVEVFRQSKDIKKVGF